MAKTWKELKAEGVHRCSAIMVNPDTGKPFQCRRRTVNNGEHVGWCKKHQPYMEAQIAKHLEVLE